jgi:cytochrome c-type biogenesis protein
MQETGGAMNPGDAFEAFYRLATTGLDAAYVVVSSLPTSYAFGAGMLATLNPCGFVMLPAFGAFYVSQAGDAASDGVLRRLQRALMMGILVTVVFVLVFGLMGALVTAGGQWVMGMMPWVGLGVGVLLVVLGVVQLATRRSLFAGVTAGVRVQRRRTAGGAIAFGVAYAACSLGCTLPIFLVVVGGVFTGRGTFGAGLERFVEYGLGMGTVLTTVVVTIAIVRERGGRWFRSLIPVAELAANGLLVLAGTYVVWYWVTKGGVTL